MLRVRYLTQLNINMSRFVQYIVTHLLLCIFFIPVPVWANDPDGTRTENGKHIEDDLQMWSPVSLQINVTPKLYTAITAQSRLSNNWRELTQLISNELIGYRATRNVAVDVGHEFSNRFDWKDNGSGLEQYIYENRLFEGVVLSHKHKSREWTFRNRLEQRWIAQNQSTGLRSRHLLGVRQYIGTNKKWYLAVNNEIFINLTNISGENSIQQGINQNRAFIGIGRKINEHLTIEAGYLMQYINNNAPKDDALNHIVQLRTLFQLDPMSKQKDTNIVRCCDQACQIMH